MIDSMIFSDRKVVTMGKENLQKNAAINIVKNIRKQIMEIYEKNDIPNLYGFKLTYEELIRDTDGLEKEIIEIMNHPRKYKSLLNVFTYFGNIEGI